VSGFIDSEPDDLDRAQAVVALGGGHGLHASLTALRRLVDDLTVDDLTAIVTVADNGGSSGRLRGEFNVLPPGDLRMALAALCGDDDWGDTWAKVLQHRCEGDGEMRGHVVGHGDGAERSLQGGREVELRIGERGRCGEIEPGRALDQHRCVGVGGGDLVGELQRRGAARTDEQGSLAVGVEFGEAGRVGGLDRQQRHAVDLDRPAAPQRVDRACGGPGVW